MGSDSLFSRLFSDANSSTTTSATFSRQSSINRSASVPPEDEIKTDEEVLKNVIEYSMELKSEYEKRATSLEEELIVSKNQLESCQKEIANVKEQSARDASAHNKWLATSAIGVVFLGIAGSWTLYAHLDTKHSELVNKSTELSNSLSSINTTLGDIEKNESRIIAVENRVYELTKHSSEMNAKLDRVNSSNDKILIELSKESKK
ncbi:hypothetical protein M2G92_11940 [Vibrio vulnificus]|nr:hypothetical protein [Vibrio vulnificus]MCU8315959.1 hypothetical protein [Vibrio vulnificus]